MQSDGRAVDERGNNDMRSGMGELERVLRLSIKRANDLSTTSSPRYRDILYAIRVFLTRWDASEQEDVNVREQQNEIGSNQSRDLPSDYLKMVFCRMLSNMDPMKRVDTIREEILSMIRSLQTISCRQLLFDFLPSVSRTFVGSDSSTRTWTEGKTKRAKKQILSCLQEVFDNDPNSLPQILQYFSSLYVDELSRKSVLVQRDAFLFVVEILPKVPETLLHIAVGALIQYVKSPEDARVAVDSVRNELALLEKTDISDMAPVATTFDEAARGSGKNQELFVEEYFVILQELVNEQPTENCQVRSEDGYQVEDVENKLLTFDLVMLIFLKDSIVHRDRILGMVADGSLLESGLFSIHHLKRLVGLADSDEKVPSNIPKKSVLIEWNPHQYLLQPLIDLSMSFLLAPLHRTIEFGNEEFFSLVRDILLRIFLELPKNFRSKAISLALRIVDDLVKGCKQSTSEVEYKEEEQLQEVTISGSDICLNIFKLLLSLLSRKREILMPYQDRFMGYLMSDSFHYLDSIEVLQTLCAILVEVTHNSDSSGPLGSIVMCRSLIFSPPVFAVGTTVDQKRRKLMCFQIRGMVLANAIISSCDLGVQLLVALHKIMSRVLLSPHSNMSILDPTLGSHGLKLLRRIRGHKQCDHSLKKDIFKIASLVLSHSRIVYYPEVSPGKSTTKPSSIFAYNDVPRAFPFDNVPAKDLRFRKMLFSFNFFIKESLLTQPSRWESSCLWTFDMIDTYLALGRTTKWNPRAWVFAGIEFPVIASSGLVTARRKQKVSNLLRSLFSSFGPSDNERIPVSRIEKRISELIKGATTASEKEAVINSVSRFTLALLFALSVSIAVLNHTYGHFKHRLDAAHDQQERDEKNEALRMVHYQFSKVCDIEKVCHSMERLFRNIGTRDRSSKQKRSKKAKKRKLNRSSASSEKTKIQIEAETVSFHIRKSVLKILHNTESISKHVFWVCLTDPLHDKLIVSTVETLRHEQTAKPNLASVLKSIQLRLNSIRHLSLVMANSTQAQKSDSQSLLEGTESVFRGNRVGSLRLTAFLLLNYPLLNSTTERGEIVGVLLQLLSEYLSLTNAILTSRTGDGPTSETNNKDYAYILATFGSKKPLHQTFEGRTVNDSLDLEDFDKLISSFRGHIDGHHSQITSQLLEMLSIFAFESDSKPLGRMIDIHWNSTFLSKYTNGEKPKDVMNGSPFALKKLLNSLSRLQPKGLTGVVVEEGCSHRVITKMMMHRYNKSLEKHQNLVYSIRRHWGLIALSPRRFQLIPIFLKTLYRKLDEYLQDVDDCSFGENTRSKGHEVLQHDDDDDDDDEYLPPTTGTPIVSKPMIPTSSDFHCLTSSSYPIYLDMLLRMTVSSIALFSLPKEIARSRQQRTMSQKDHPVNELERMTTIYGRLIEVYRRKFHVFPKFLQSSITSISKCMLDVAAVKSREYIEWRNRQPLRRVEEKSSGLDMASTVFLKKLLDSFGVHVIGTLHRFCSAHSQMQGGDKPSVGNSAMPGLKILARKNERTFEFLSETSNRYGTGDVCTVDGAHDASERDNQTSTKDSEHTPSVGHLPTMEESLEMGVGQESQNEIETKTDLLLGKRRSRRNSSSRSTGSHDPSKSEDDESFVIDDSDGSLSSASDAFGVSGDWGQESKDSDEELDSEFFVDTFQKSS